MSLFAFISDTSLAALSLASAILLSLSISLSVCLSTVFFYAGFLFSVAGLDAAGLDAAGLDAVACLTGFF